MSVKYRFSAILILVFAVGSFAQPKPSHPGIELYRAGKVAAAADSLSAAVKQKAYENVAEIWNFLGLAQIAIEDLKSARKSLERAVKLDPNVSAFQSNLAYIYMLLGRGDDVRAAAARAIALDRTNLQAYYFRGRAGLREGDLTVAEIDADNIIEIGPNWPYGYILKSNVVMARLTKRVSAGSNMRDELPLLRSATEILQNGREKCRASAEKQVIDEAYASTAAFLNYFANNKDDVRDPAAAPAVNAAVRPLQIISKPPAGYTDSARQAVIQGTVKIAVLFGANGRVESAILLSRLGNGLDESALKAARGITFRPMERDGKPVPVVKLVEYSFSIY